MWDAAFYFILQATPTISDQNYKHAIQNLRNERYKMNAGIVVQYEGIKLTHAAGSFLVMREAF